MPTRDPLSAAGSLASFVGDRFVACAESCTAGRVATALAAVGGSGDWFRGGLVAYDVEMKRSLLGVTAPSVYSELAVGQMATGVARLMSATIAVATSGVAGPAPVEGVAPGTVFFGCLDGGALVTEIRRFPGDAVDVCTAAATAALEILAGHLAGRPAEGAR